MPKTKSSSIFSIILPILVVLALGVGTGYGLFVATGSTSSSSGGSGGTKMTAAGGKINVGDTFGVDEKEAGQDTAEGVLDKGGVNGEGSHKLLRPGGESQNVYLTSSVVDLDEYVGHKVKVWGNTFKGQKAGWLMDVGRVKIVELDADKPF